MFRLLGLHPGPDVTLPSAASLVGLRPGAAADALGRLAGGQLVTERTAGRYVLHDLLHAYAAELAEAVESSVSRRQALVRLLDHYTHTAWAANLLLDPQDTADVLPAPAAGVLVAPPADSDGALAWFSAEHQVLLALLKRAGAAGLDEHVGRLAGALAVYLNRRGQYFDLLTIQQAALLAAVRRGDPASTAEAHRGLGIAYAQLQRTDEAAAEFERALAGYGRLGDSLNRAHTYLNLACLGEAQGRPQYSIRQSRQALKLFRAAGSAAWSAEALNALGWYHGLAGDYRSALRYCNRALAQQQTLDDRVGAAHTWDSLGYAYQHLGQNAQAVTCFERSLVLLEEVGDRYYEASVRIHLGEVHQAAGRTAATCAAWQEALLLLDNLDHPDAMPLRRRLATLVL